LAKRGYSLCRAKLGPARELKNERLNLKEVKEWKKEYKNGEKTNLRIELVGLI
jgi:hypothetical protein